MQALLYSLFDFLQMRPWITQFTSIDGIAWFAYCCKRKLVDKIKIINVSGFEECFILIYGFKSEKISNFCIKGKEQGEN